ncbi:DUF2845 domain-containing protein [Stutzerimonas nitrititolerans]|uniref:DUF2845 domain-containing protein n=2 Tax=Stutzerimonas nitrititolerans TaxID=2482751 RepID=A0ABX9V477_9GAMM|nr:DUF2845 domain-containing protein [Stutzerimonas nitrititolerans]
MKFASPIFLISALLGAGQTYAETMRCNEGIIATGASSYEVLTKCGEPSDKEVVNPTVQPDGNLPRGAVTVETWVYGPNNGAHNFLRFIDGKLVKIETRRL